MSGNISLTASMRSNLLSLQNISRTVGATQNKLATGNKVNSAIDNPSSYYTARNLNNRANDLDALLDSMGQAVSTIKTATTALETGATFLEQAAAVATSALETNTIPPKAFFEEKVGANGAVVTTAQELKDAVAAGKETICVYGQIDYFTDRGIRLQAGQKLVGTEYFTGYTGSQKISQINFVSTSTRNESCILLADNTLVSDLQISLDSTASEIGTNAILLNKRNSSATVNNININMQQTQNPVPGAASSAIKTYVSGATINVTGHNRIEGTGYYVSGTFAHDGGTINYLSDSTTDIWLPDTNFSSGAAIYTWINATTNIAAGATVNVKSDRRDAAGILNDSTLNISGTLNVEQGKDGKPLNLWGHANYCGNTVNIKSSARLNFKITDNSWLSYSGLETSKTNKVDIAAGTQINIFHQGQEQNFVSNGYQKNSESPGIKLLTIDNILSMTEFTKTSSQANIDWNNIVPETPHSLGFYYDSTPYQNILTQYDTIIKDSSYKGVNLLKNEKLNVRFNEKGDADLNVSGKDMSAGALGLNTVNWGNQGDIAQSLKEIAGALKSIRAFTAELGNNYSIITNRQEFTENLINILTEGADKLTLADMNEESANMLSLQTRQQLAINSLSLASQASQSILKLF